MGNTFTAGNDDRVSLSNGATRVLFDVLALAGSATAATPWQQRLTLLFCDSERHSSGCSGVDLADLPWTGDHAAEQQFFLHVLDRALDRHGWERLHYDPPLVGDHLRAFRRMLAGFAPRPFAGSPMGDWTRPPEVHEVDRCVRHQVFRGEHGCRLCDVSCQPLDAPRVWELVSLRRAEDGRIAHREVVQVHLGPEGSAGDGTGPPRPVEPGDPVASALGRALDPGQEHYLQVAVA